MKFFLVALALVAAVAADVSELPSTEYLPPVAAPAPVPTSEYLPPVQDAAPAHELADDGYRYKTVKRYRFRHRRDVNELPSNEYLPPVQDVAPVSVPPLIVPASALPIEPAHELASDGYRYKTVKRYRYRHRRDVNELPSQEYLPPVSAPAPTTEYLPPVQDVAPAHELSDDGYRYKTVKRYRYRHRRDVNELPSQEYLPPVSAPAPTTEYLPPVQDVAPAHELSDDGYRYKTVKRYRYRHRRDVNELPSQEYLPPVSAPAPTTEYLPPVQDVAPAHELSDDGYRYKTVKRYRYRHRRDVNELPSNEYLPPVQEAPVEIAAPVVEAEPAHELANDGYRYKTVKRYRYRHRRDVNELPSQEYLPPVQDVAAPVSVPPLIVPASALPIEPAHELASDGYRYKTVKRYRYRHRRDVNELPSNEYLPPVQEAPVEIAAPVVEAEPAHELANDGYRYKTVKRYRYRHRRDVNELPSQEYLPPVSAPAPTVEYLPPVQDAAPAHELSNDGYRYKTVKRYRLKYRL